MTPEEEESLYIGIERALRKRKLRVVYEHDKPSRRVFWVLLVCISCALISLGFFLQSIYR